MTDKVYILWENDNEPQIIAVFNKKPSNDALMQVFDEEDFKHTSDLSIDDAVKLIQETGVVYLKPGARAPYYFLEEREVNEA